MNQLSPTAPDLTLSRCRAVALLVDGDQFPVSLAGRAILTARDLGMLAVLRIYGNSALSDGWRDLGYHPIQVEAGKNVTDMTLIVAAMDLSYAGSVDGFVIATRDRDFVPLVRSLRERRFPVWGLSHDPMPAHLKAVFTTYISLKAPTEPSVKGQTALPSPKPKPVVKPPAPRACSTDLEAIVRAVLASGPKSPKEFGSLMGQKKTAVPTGSAKWQSWLKAHAAYVLITGSGTGTRFTLKT